MKKALLALLLLGAAAILLGAIRGSHGPDTVSYRLATVEQGDVEALVSATGTLDAVTTVQVGTQVSGIIDEICVDFNDPVEEGQVIARIDTTLLANAVAGAEASLAHSRAELLQAQREYTRIQALHDENMVSDSEYNAGQYSLDAARASVQSAEVDIARARQTLNYATITSPIDGTVISRSIDVGQTVQASFSAPELFLIAGDLTSMQILVAVDESDIGQISEGQTARFTVQAYPDDTFTGTVRQVRLQSSTEENVVNYTAVVDVANPDGSLLPGMTATVDFLVETATDVLYVANASLRYKPDEEMMAAALEKLRSRRESSRGDDAAPPPSPMGNAPDAAAANRGMLWTLDDEGELAPVPVRTGISDGTNTEVMGRDLEAGIQVIAGVSSSAAAANSTSSPFQQQDSGRQAGPPPRGGM
ncbi:MAG: efflux RND transporter periplasmic adaptor subunit [Candidatus Krumholzibacteria bacterium]|nr:efflux RND transporter periplasmic adaptor subunit [Candidatus Krumholzibacteria bacterium]